MVQPAVFPPVRQESAEGWTPAFAGVTAEEGKSSAMGRGRRKLQRVGRHPQAINHLGEVYVFLGDPPGIVGG